MIRRNKHQRYLDALIGCRRIVSITQFMNVANVDSKNSDILLKRAISKGHIQLYTAKSQKTPGGGANSYKYRPMRNWYKTTQLGEEYIIKAKELHDTFNDLNLEPTLGWNFINNKVFGHRLLRPARRKKWVLDEDSLPKEIIDVPSNQIVIKNVTRKDQVLSKAQVPILADTTGYLWEKEQPKHNEYQPWKRMYENKNNKAE